MIYHPEYKGIRLDVYAKGRENTHYNIEMQGSEKNLHLAGEAAIITAR